MIYMIDSEDRYTPALRLWMREKLQKSSLDTHIVKRQRFFVYALAPHYFLLISLFNIKIYLKLPIYLHPSSMYFEFGSLAVLENYFDFQV